MNELEEGLKFGGYLLREVRFVDDRGMVANTVKGLQAITDRLNEAAKLIDMKINANKRKVMKVMRNGGAINKIIDRQQT